MKGLVAADLTPGVARQRRDLGTMSARRVAELAVRMLQGSTISRAKIVRLYGVSRATGGRDLRVVLGAMRRCKVPVVRGDDGTYQVAPPSGGRVQ